MRAVNLIPADARIGGGAGSAGRSGGAVYVLLGGLAVLVAMVGLWALTGGKISDQRAELARIQQDVAQTRARAGALQSPGEMQQLRLARTEMVRSLASQRRDWAETLDAISRTLPADTTLTSLDAKTAASAPPPGTASATGGTAPGPTVSLGGCAPSQRAVAQLMPRLRTVPDVVSVKLLSSSTGGGDGGAAAGQTETDSCDGATFSMDLVLEGTALAAPATATTPATPQQGAEAPTSTTATTAVQGTPDAGTGGAQ